ncbi:putative transcription initiation factor TFIID, 23-30kDa subunit [Septoria linicola]|nr:putative transcription initiation factor TFIID, 23-30kDa subunit [Septoria linicola]
MADNNTSAIASPPPPPTDAEDAKPDPASSSSTLAHNTESTDNSQAAATAAAPTESAVDDSAALDAKQERDLDAEITDAQQQQQQQQQQQSQQEGTVMTDAGVTTTTNVDEPATSQPPATIERANGLKAPEEPRIPVKKDTSLREFMGKMDDYAPLIPDAVTDYYLTLAGLPPPPETDRRLARLLALATQKFIADIAADAYQYSRIRSTNTTSNNPLTGLGGAAGFGLPGGAGDEAAGKGKKDTTGKAAPLGGPRAGYGGGGASGGQGRTVLTMEDLGMAVGEYGVNVKRGEFYR